jgi:glycosyltransferase involved in cell wall biosynthesis
MDEDVVATASNGVEFSVVIPCLNEIRTIGACVDEAFAGLARACVRGEVVVADNDSSDGSAQVAQSRGARVIHVRARGYGSALQAGISACQGQYVIMGDADGSHDLGQLGVFIRRLRQGDELVLGNRFQGGIEQGAMPWLHQYIGNPFLSTMVNLLFRTRTHDVYCGFRAFSKRSYERLGMASPGMEFAVEMVVRAKLYRLKVSEVPTVQRPDGRGRPPHMRTFRDGWRTVRLLLLLCPVWLYIATSAVLLALGFALLACALSPGRGPVADIRSMLCGVWCLVVSYQTLWLWGYAKLYGWECGLLPADTFSDRVFRHINLERGLCFGAFLMVMGLILITRSVPAAPVVDESTTSILPPLCGLVAMLSGAQTIYGSFFLSMLGLARKANPSRSQ